MSDKTVISMAFPTKLLKKIDKLAKAQYTTRSDYIRQTMLRVTDQTKTEELKAAWEELINGADELNTLAKKAGYVTDADFTRLAKEIKQDRKLRR